MPEITTEIIKLKKSIIEVRHDEYSLSRCIIVALARKNMLADVIKDNLTNADLVSLFKSKSHKYNTTIDQGIISDREYKAICDTRRPAQLILAKKLYDILKINFNEPKEIDKFASRLKVKINIYDNERAKIYTSANKSKIEINLLKYKENYNLIVNINGFYIDRKKSKNKKIDISAGIKLEPVIEQLEPVIEQLEPVIEQIEFKNEQEPVIEQLEFKNEQEPVIEQLEFKNEPEIDEWSHPEINWIDPEIIKQPKPEIERYKIQPEILTNWLTMLDSH